MLTPRFHCPQAVPGLARGARVELPPDASHHALRVLPELALQPAFLSRSKQPSIRPTLLLMLPSSSTAPPLPPVQAQAHPKLGKQVDYLGKLVRATVQAMAVQQGAAQ